MNKFKRHVGLFALILTLYTEGSFAQVAVNTDGSAADSKAMLDVKSTSKGLLMPRMTTAQRTTNIVAPIPEGLLVYDITTHSVWQYNATTSAWVEVGSEVQNLHVLGRLTVGSSTASDINSTALGSSTASNINAFASGYSTASGLISTALGASTATGSYAVALGNTNTASGTNATVLGSNSVASGNLSTALGSNAEATGNNTVAMGSGTSAKAYSSVALGSYNDFINSSSPTTWVTTDPLLIVGNGTSSARSNALVLYKNGDLKVSGNLASGNSITSGTYCTGLGSGAAYGSYATALCSATANGFNSFAAGNAVTSNSFATALGHGAASGEYSTSLGNATAGGSYSTAGGGAMAGGNYSTAFGGTATRALAEGATAFGVNGLATGIRSTFSGGDGVSTGYYSTALGNSSAYADFATALGRSQAVGLYATTGGYSTATGYFSAAFGNTTHAKAYACLAIGQFNDSIASSNSTTWQAADPVFIIGNGSPSVRSNIFVINKNGTAFLNGLILLTSDRRLKRDITPLSNALDKVLKINGMHYYWKDTTTHESRLQAGVIAQDVQAVMPELVNTDHKGMLSVNYLGLVPYLVESVKSLKKENDDLKKANEAMQQQIASLNTLKADVEALKAALATPSVKIVKTASTERK